MVVDVISVKKACFFLLKGVVFGEVREKDWILGIFRTFSGLKSGIEEWVLNCRTIYFLLDLWEVWEVTSKWASKLIFELFEVLEQFVEVDFLRLMCGWNWYGLLGEQVFALECKPRPTRTIKNALIVQY